MSNSISKWFIIKKIDKNHKKLLTNYAINIRKQKNILSKLISENICISYTYKNEIITSTLLEELFFYSKRFSKDKFVKVMTPYRNEDLVDGVAYQQLCRQLYTLYVEYLSRISYKNKKEKNASQDIFYAKKYLIQHPKNTKDEYIEYLTYLKDNIDKYEVELDIINSCLENINDWFLDIHNYHLNYLNNIKSITMKSLTYQTINVLSWNNYTLNKIDDRKVCIKLRIPNKETIDLYAKYSYDYFGDINDFLLSIRRNKQKQPIQTCMTYTLKFLTNGNIKIIFTKNVDKNDMNKKSLTEKAIGIDLNTKHNFLQCSDGTSFNYDKYVINKERKLRYYLKKIALNKSKNHNQNNKHSKKSRLREEKQKRRRDAHANKKANEVLRYCLKNDIKRVVVEDLNISLKTPKKIKKNKDFLQNHIQVALHFNDFKNVLKRILNKNDIEVDFVNPKYTSRTCPICGHISKNNRPSQEQFICEECNHRDNADLNASINILQRITNDTFRNAFEYYDKKAKMFKGRKIRNLKVYQDIYKKELA